MIFDPITILGVSDSNPIQLWPPAKPTFNQIDIRLLDKKYYFQKFNFNETLYNRLDVAFNSRRYENYDVGSAYPAGSVVYDPGSFMRWQAKVDLIAGLDPRDEISTDGTYWKVIDGDPINYNALTEYNSGDRAVDGGADGYLVVWQSLADANEGNTPLTHPDLWEQVRLTNGHVSLKLVVPDPPDDYDSATTYKIGDRARFKYDFYTSNSNGNTDNTPDDSIEWDLDQNNTIQFDNIRSGSTHQATMFLWSVYAFLSDVRLSVLVWDDQNETVLANSDCFDVLVDAEEPYVNIIYTNSDDWDGVAYENVNPQFYLRLKAHFYRQQNPVDVEDHNLSNGIVVSLRKQLTTKRLLQIIEELPDYMHQKVVKILTHDSLTIQTFTVDAVLIDELSWKFAGDYKRDDQEADTLSSAEVLLTQQDSVQTNISRYDPFSAGRVFTGEFSEPFS